MYRTYTKGTVYSTGQLREDRPGTRVVTEHLWKHRRDYWRDRFVMWWLLYKFDHRWPISMTEIEWEFDMNLPQKALDWLMTRVSRVEEVERTTYYEKERDEDRGAPEGAADPALHDGGQLPD